MACLAGDNGHGKSALLDAMTWALWGKSRASNDDSLIHLGAREMEVEFEFALGENCYRVIRKRRRGTGRRSGQTVLELQVWDGERFRSISEPTVRATERRIRDLLHLDYETFINSAFLVQGRADEFTTKRPGERKQVLADILGLDVYDTYEERAKERARECAEAVNALEAQIHQLDEEIARRPEYEAEEREAARLVAELSGQLREAERQLEELRARHRDLLNQRQELDRLEARLRREEAELEQVERRLAEARSRLQALEAILADQEEIEEGYRAWQEALAAEREWREKRLAVSQLETERARLEGDIRSARARLEAELRAAEAEAARWSELAGRVEEHRQAVEEARTELETLSQRVEETDRLREQITALVDEIAGLRMQNDLLKGEMEALKEKIELLQTAAEAACPLCGQPLAEPDRERLMAEFEAEGKAKADQFRKNAQQVKALEAEQRKTQRRLTELERELKAQAQWQRRLAQAEQALAESERAAEALAEAESRMTRLRDRLHREEYGMEARVALAELEARLQAIGYDAVAHEQARAAVAQYATFEARYAELQRALASVEAERRAVAQLAERREALARALEEEGQRRKELAAAVEELPAVEAAVRAQDQEVLTLASQEQEARLRLGAAQQKLATCEQQEKIRAQRQRELEKVREEQAIYEELREAFGKRGLQAMIIETVVPEIEDEANRLLSRMTDGRMSVTLQTQRDTKTGGTVETLDILIQDEVGQRPYEMFSGGEAFRVNFALRIALSKLLTRRAGARLQTLFIDEGFGSQDAQGRQRLVEAIQSIQDDFERILVITHIEELRDLFPVRIDVVKTPEGSQISLS
ncbi:MAG TPA: SMC family ATPase [Caldilineae bacterium]|nr:SMC family ATPase [Caldilineae bacterium]